jgi:hypothetical protein
MACRVRGLFRFFRMRLLHKLATIRNNMRTLNIKAKWTRFLSFCEQPLFLLAAGIVGGIVGTFLYRWVLAVCCLCVLLAFHKHGTVRGKSLWKVQIPAYTGLFILSALGCYLIATKLDTASREWRDELVKAIRNSQKADEAKQEQLSPFSVSVDWAMIGMDDKEHATNFWIDYPVQDSCSISPIQAVFFVRIKNLRKKPITVIGYSLDMGLPLIKANMGDIVAISNKESTIFGPKMMSAMKVGTEIHFGQGPGFSIVEVPRKDSDFKHGLQLQMDLIENLLKTPLQPDVPIRGWGFFQSPNGSSPIAGLGHITLETDDSHTYTYGFDLKNPHPDLDMLDRIMRVKSFKDLTDCKRN